MIKEAIARLIDRQSLSIGEAEAVMQEIMLGEATPSQIGAFLIALRMKQETAEEIVGCARAMRAHALKVETNHDPVIDTCGTGGDGTGTFNVSTVVAFIVAGAGVAVAKHGNRSVSSRCGSADVLEALGARIDLGPDQISKCLNETGIGFLFAPALHPAMKHAAVPRREIGARTIFNILGPLTNPASASIQLLGVYDPGLTETVASVLGMMGATSALVVHGAHGLDELSTTGTNKVTELSDAKVTSYQLDPQDLGLPRADLSSLKGGLPEENARIMKRLLEGEPGPKRDVSLLNSAAALVATGSARDFKEGLHLAAESVDSGRALEKLEHFIRLTNSIGVAP
ncbi:MAG: anthranilate phosphoribosyltransferase [Chloroflexi bacterium]|nr:MAG: anthranilate phosphoribosyltransferase [Chloroflexota bacterium]